MTKLEMRLFNCRYLTVLEAFQTILKLVYKFLRLVKMILGSNYNRSCDFKELLYFFKKQLNAALNWYLVKFCAQFYGFQIMGFGNYLSFVFLMAMFLDSSVYVIII